VTEQGAASSPTALTDAAVPVTPPCCPSPLPRSPPAAPLGAGTTAAAELGGDGAPGPSQLAPQLSPPSGVCAGCVLPPLPPPPPPHWLWLGGCARRTTSGRWPPQAPPPGARGRPLRVAAARSASALVRHQTKAQPLDSRVARSRRTLARMTWQPAELKWDQRSYEVQAGCGSTSEGLQEHGAQTRAGAPLEGWPAGLVGCLVLYYSWLIIVLLSMQQRRVRFAAHARLETALKLCSICVHRRQQRPC
jgi:hypothetical protein